MAVYLLSNNLSCYPLLYPFMLDDRINIVQHSNLHLSELTVHCDRYFF